MLKNENDLLLYAVTDRKCLREGIKLEDAVQDAISGGAGMIQLREKNMDTIQMMNEAVLIHRICEHMNVPLIINDDIKIAAIVNADGVHVGQEDMAVSDARKKLGNKKIIGATAHNVKEALEAERQGADYIGAGAVFGSVTKSDTSPLTYDGLKAICDAVKIPVVAIGGINSSNILRLQGSGIAGTAVVSGIFAADDIKAAAKGLSDLIHQMKGHI